MPIFGIRLPWERRSVNDPAAPWGPTWETWMKSTEGATVTRERALGIPAVFAAVKAVSETLASIPFELYERTPEGSQAAITHPLYDLLRLEPSPDYSSYDFRVALFANACFGNAYALIHRNGIGRAVEFEILDPLSVEPFQTNEGSRFYIVHHQVGNTVKILTVYPRDMIHIKALSMDGISGLSTTRIHQKVHSGAIASQEYADYYFSNGAHVGGALIYPTGITKDQYDRANSKMNGGGQSGIKRTGQTLILDAGVKYEKFGQNPEEAGLIKYRAMVVDDQARIFGVPVPILAKMDQATLQNMEQMFRQFVTLGLRSWAVQAEQEFDRKALFQSERKKFFTRFNLDGLMRGDTQAQADFLDKMMKNMAYTINDARDFLNANKVPWGNRPFAQAGMVQIEEDGSIELPEPPNAQDTPSDPASDTQDNTDNGTPQAGK